MAARPNGWYGSTPAETGAIVRMDELEQRVSVRNMASLLGNQSHSGSAAAAIPRTTRTPQEEPIARVLPEPNTRRPPPPLPQSKPSFGNSLVGSLIPKQPEPIPNPGRSPPRLSPRLPPREQIAPNRPPLQPRPVTISSAPGNPLYRVPPRPVSYGDKAIKPPASPELPSSQEPPTKPAQVQQEPSSDRIFHRPGWMSGSKQKTLETLCKPCSKIEFEKLALPPESQGQGKEGKTKNIIDLKHLIKHRLSCNFCAILFQALCLPENDPLQDLDLQGTIQEEDAFKNRREPASPFFVSFETWVDVRENVFLKQDARWPFGYTKDSIQIGEYKKNNDDNAEIDVEFEEGSNVNANYEVIGGSYKMGLATAEHFDNDSERGRWYSYLQKMVPDAAFFGAMSKNKVPAALRVIVYSGSHPKAGVLEVTAFGSSKLVARQIKVLSQFHLRVAVPYTSVGPMQPFRYGNRIRTLIDLELCQQWLANCRGVHGDKCDAPHWARGLTKPSATGFRLIDVLDRAVVEPGAKQCEYAALSYVWGDDPKHLEGLEKAGLNNMGKLGTSGYLTDGRVGHAIADAMKVVRRLGLRYLWADRLCIVQEKCPGQHEQITQMDRIYGNAVVTIVSASAEHANAPIVGISIKRHLSQLAEEVLKNPSVNVLLPLQNKTGLGPWETRAWTFQEKLMSKRLLIFHNGVVDFYCACGVMHEDMTAEDAGSDRSPIDWLSLADPRLTSSVTADAYDRNGPRLLRSPIFAEYANVLGLYSLRQMGDPKDAVQAVSGLLRLLINNQQQEGARKPLLCGLPEEFLDQALHWQPAAGEENIRLCLRSERPPKPGVERTDFPTWSWAAWEAAEETVGGRTVTCPGGIRYELPFRIQTDVLGRLKKVLWEGKVKPEEYMRPLVKWYVLDRRGDATQTSRSQTFPAPRSGPRLRPLNGTGHGLIMAGDANDVAEWDEAVRYASGNLDRSEPSLPADVLEQLTEKHLVFRTRIARFRLGELRTRTETIWKHVKKPAVEAGMPPTDQLVVHAQFKIHETAILDSKGAKIGGVVLPDPRRKFDPEQLHDFVLLSEAQFRGNETKIALGVYPLFSVMLVQWDKKRGRPFATRLAMGRLKKEKWWLAGGTEEVVILG